MMPADRCVPNLVHWRGSVHSATNAMRVALAGLSLVLNSRSPASSLANEKVYWPVMSGWIYPRMRAP